MLLTCMESEGKYNDNSGVCFCIFEMPSVF